MEAVAECDDDAGREVPRGGRAELDEEVESAACWPATRAGDHRARAVRVRDRGARIPKRCWAASGARCCPRPADRKPLRRRPRWRGRDRGGRDPEAPFSATVFKTMIDRYAGTLSVLPGGVGHAARRHLGAERHHRRTRSGSASCSSAARASEHVEVPEAGPGDVVAVAKLKSVHTGHALTAEKGGTPSCPRSAHPPRGDCPTPSRPQSKGDEDKVLLLARTTRGGGSDASAGARGLHRRVPPHGDAASCTSGPPSRSCSRMFDVDVELQTPEGPVPGDDHAAVRRTSRASSRNRPEARGCSASAT